MAHQLDQTTELTCLTQESMSNHQALIQYNKLVKVIRD